MISYKRLRVQQVLFEEINSLIVMKKIKDPRVSSHTSVVSIKVAKDTSFATVYISGYISQKRLTETVMGLNHAKGYIQSIIAKKYQLRNTPKLNFKESDALLSADAVLQQLQALKK